MKVSPDPKHRNGLTKKVRSALNLKPISSGTGKLVSKGTLKVYRGSIPDVDVEEAVAKSRDCTRS